MNITELGADDLSIRAGGRLVIEHHDFKAHSGELVGLSGPSGSGKTLLLYTLAGMRSPHTGAITIDGRPSLPWKDTTVALLTETLPLPPLLTVAETIAIALQSQGLPRSEITARTGAALDQLGLADLSDQTVVTLSGGQRQRVAITQAVIRCPNIILADEPTAALDAKWRHTAMALFAAAAHHGAIVVVASNDTDTLNECHRVTDITDTGH